MTQLRELHVITNDWHMDRTKTIFNYVFSLPFNYLSSSLRSHALNPYILFFYAVDSGLSSLIHEERVKREKISLQTFNRDTKLAFKDINDMRDWIFQKHSAYSTSRLNSKAEKIDPMLLKSY